MRGGWRTTVHGEWIRDHVGLVAHVEGRGWYGYPFRLGLPRGPFPKDEDAMQALERSCAVPCAEGKSQSGD